MPHRLYLGTTRNSIRWLICLAHTNQFPPANYNNRISNHKSIIFLNRFILATINGRSKYFKLRKSWSGPMLVPKYSECYSDLTVA